MHSHDINIKSLIASIKLWLVMQSRSSWWKRQRSGYFEMLHPISQCFLLMSLPVQRLPHSTLVTAAFTGAPIHEHTSCKSTTHPQDLTDELGLTSCHGNLTHRYACLLLLDESCQLAFNKTINLFCYAYSDAPLCSFLRPTHQLCQRQPGLLGPLETQRRWMWHCSWRWTMGMAMHCRACTILHQAKPDEEFCMLRNT